MPIWGKALFDAVFSAPLAKQLFDDFMRKSTQEPGILTILARQPSIHATPWELLRESIGDGRGIVYPGSSIVVRRRLVSVDGGMPWTTFLTRLRQRINRIWRQRHAIARKLFVRVVARARILLVTHRFGKILALLAASVSIKPSEVKPGGVWYRLASPVGAPLAAAALLGSAVRFAIGRLMAATPPSGVSAGQWLQLADTVRFWASYGTMAFALVGIYAAALANRMFTGALWHLLARVSRGGEIPTWRWFTWRVSSFCVYISVFIFGMGFLVPHLRPEAISIGPLQRFFENTLLVLSAGFFMILVNHLQTRHISAINHEIWGTRWKAVLSALLKLVVIFALPWLLEIALPLNLD